MNLSLVEGPTVWPLTIPEAKEHLRVESDFADDDTYIETMIQVATEYCEDKTKRKFQTQTWDMFLDGFGSSHIVLPFGQLQSVSYVTYRDSGGTTNTWADTSYMVVTEQDPGYICPVYGGAFPCSVLDVGLPVTVRFVCGYGGKSSDVPVQVRHAIKIMLAHWYQNREPNITGTLVTPLKQRVDSLLASQTLFYFGVR